MHRRCRAHASDRCWPLRMIPFVSQVFAFLAARNASLCFQLLIMSCYYYCCCCCSDAGNVCQSTMVVCAYLAVYYDVMGQRSSQSESHDVWSDIFKFCSLKRWNFQWWYHVATGIRSLSPLKRKGVILQMTKIRIHEGRLFKLIDKLQ